ncbi:ABC transporter substrate-binding protein [Halarcobacter sp.]|uniref:transporter substrate-binding domain-containing diguanylate cyclase n=1 Tax=Halarcobacter sp. TaxID=2321133 RepID=UPI002AABF0C4|nr:ABC transporter substrate-binding protein [Halarcobacter sp.]
MNLIKIIISLTLFSSILSAQKLEKVSIQLDWLHQFQFAGFYIAKEKGYYKNQGFDVSIKEYNSDINVVEDVLKKKSDYGVGKSSLIIDRLENKKVVLLNAIYQTSPMVLITKKDLNITKPSELKNKKVMLTSDARSAASINSMIMSQGLELEDINFQKHSFNLDDLINGKTDAMGCYLSNEPYLLEKKGIKYNVLNPSDYGFDFYGGIFFTSEDELMNHSKRVRKIYRATMRGWEYAFNNIEETAKIIYEKYNTQNKSLESLIYEGQVLKKLSKIEDGLLGKLDKNKIKEMQRLYILLGFGDKNIKIPKVEDFVYDSLNILYSLNQKKYIKQTKIKLLSDNNFPPFTMMVDNKVQGIEIDYWKLIAKRLNLKNSEIEIVNNSKKSLEKIKKNPNLIKYAFSKRDKTEITALTDSIAEIKIGLASFMDTPYISDINELNGKKIAIIKYTSYYKMIKKNYPKINFVEVKNAEEGILLLKEKKVYAIVNKIPALNYTISNKGLNDIKIIGSFDEKYDLKLVVNAENKMLINLLNKAIATISEKDRESISSKYYSIVYQKNQDYKELYKILIPLIILLLFIFRSNRVMNKEIKRREEVELQLNKVANIDSLTNIYNRRKMTSIFDNEINRSKRYKRELSIIFFDIDNFKLINDNLSHSHGDKVLKSISTLIKNSIRKTDFFGRWGGEEFIIILPETDKEKAGVIANLLKEKISKFDFDINRPVTCSFGITSFNETDNKDSVLTRVDHAMYYVKKHGKNDIKVV